MCTINLHADPYIMYKNIYVNNILINKGSFNKYIYVFIVTLHHLWTSFHCVPIEHFQLPFHNIIINVVSCNKENISDIRRKIDPMDLS